MLRERVLRVQKKFFKFRASTTTELLVVPASLDNSFEDGTIDGTSAHASPNTSVVVDGGPSRESATKEKIASLQ